MSNTAHHCQWGWFKTQILLETLTIESQHRVNLMYLWESNVSSHKLDVQEANVSVSQWVPQIRKLFRWMLVCEWTVFQFRSFECCAGIVAFIELTENLQPREQRETVCAILTSSWQRSVTIMLISCQIRSRCHKRKFFSMWSTVVHFWGQRSGDQNDRQRKNSDDETRVPKPQSRVRLVVWQNQFGPEKSKSNLLTPKNILLIW